METILLDSFAAQQCFLSGISVFPICEQNAISTKIIRMILSKLAKNVTAKLSLSKDF